MIMSEYDLLKNLGLALLKKIKTIVTNKYLLAIAVFFVLSFFALDNTYIDRWNNRNKIRELNSQIESYDKQIETCMRKMNELNTNKTNLERFAREEYYMKRTNEEVFIIEDEE